MLRKLICWLFGHAILYKEDSGKTARVIHPIMTHLVEVPVMYIKKSPYCLRCGKDIK